MDKKVIIAGFGTAAMSAIIALRNSGFNGEILVFNAQDNARPYSPVLLPYFVSEKMSEEEIYTFGESEIEELHINLHAGEAVLSVDADAHKITTDASDYSYDKLLLCTGSSANVEHINAACGCADFNVLRLRNLDDARLAKERLNAENCHRVLICGSSMIALKCVEMCLDMNKEVNVLMRSEQIFKSCTVEEASSFIEGELTKKGVEFIKECGADSIEISDDKYCMEFSNGYKDQFEEIIVAQGVKDNIEWFTCGCSDDKQSKTNEFMQTEEADIYAAGDIACSRNLLQNTVQKFGLYKTAALQGKIAGINIAAELSDTNQKLQ
ncbi:MAG: NAD(P)/FAD-dependent oxidoreductase, partial [Clostridia bacterium]|nr:NAD(P)/FAD-dependent oxidoreductase [Clostridia bacterium]